MFKPPIQNKSSFKRNAFSNYQLELEKNSPLSQGLRSPYLVLLFGIWICSRETFYSPFQKTLHCPWFAWKKNPWTSFRLKRCKTSSFKSCIFKSVEVWTFGRFWLHPFFHRNFWVDLTDFSASSSTTANLKPQTGSTQEILFVLPEICMGHLRQNDAVLLGSREQGSKQKGCVPF